MRHETVVCATWQVVALQGINNFCREIGITRTGGELPLHILDYHVRADLHLTSARTLAVLHPLKVVITNLPEDHYEMVDAKASPLDCAVHNFVTMIPPFKPLKHFCNVEMSLSLDVFESIFPV